jgi:hypothetical protein
LLTKESRSLRWMPRLQPKRTTCQERSRSAQLERAAQLKRSCNSSCNSHLGFVSPANQVRTPYLGGRLDWQQEREPLRRRENSSGGKNSLRGMVGALSAAFPDASRPECEPSRSVSRSRQGAGLRRPRRGFSSIPRRPSRTLTNRAIAAIHSRDRLHRSGRTMASRKIRHHDGGELRQLPELLGKSDRG